MRSSDGLGLELLLAFAKAGLWVGVALAGLGLITAILIWSGGGFGPEGF